MLGNSLPSMLLLRPLDYVFLIENKWAILDHFSWSYKQILLRLLIIIIYPTLHCFFPFSWSEKCIIQKSLHTDTFARFPTVKLLAPHLTLKPSLLEAEIISSLLCIIKITICLSMINYCFSQETKC